MMSPAISTERTETIKSRNEVLALLEDIMHLGRQSIRCRGLVKVDLKLLVLVSRVVHDWYWQ